MEDSLGLRTSLFPRGSVIKSGGAYKPDRGIEKEGQIRAREHSIFCSIGDDLSMFEKYDAGNFRRYLVYMVGD